MRWWTRRWQGPRRVVADFGFWLLAAVSYVPLLLTHTGMVGADTKTYLYLNPGRLLSRAPYLWDPGTGLGTVTHQNIGYLFPMGPYYAAMDWLGLPDWVSQRIWMGSVIFLAGLGVRHLLRTLDWQGRGTTIASLSYALSPYLLHYIYKHSVILLPFTALPWLLSLLVRSLREGGWRYPALFALVTLASGGINATSLILVMIGPLLWLIHAVFIEKEITLRAAMPPLLRIGLLTLITSLWWMAGLLLQGSNGIDILRYTETYKTVSNASSATEVLRGFGYWFFYGTDALGPWFKSAVTMTESIPALVISFALPLAALIAALFTRWRYRVFFVGMAIAGLVVSVGAFPFDNPSPYGSIFASFTKSESGLALRSTPRAVPLVALSAAIFLAAGAAALAKKLPTYKVLISVAAVGLVLANMSPLFTGNGLDAFLERPENVPNYWTQAAADLQRGDSATRVLEVPGIEFANYRWGSTVDPITPGLTGRDFAARELIPWGSPASADLMNAVDLPFQTAGFDQTGYANLLRLMGVSQLVARNDLEYERYKTPRPRIMTSWLDAVKGLSKPQEFGAGDVPPNRAVASNPLIDDTELAIPPGEREPAPVEIRTVSNALPIVRTVQSSAPTVLSGSGDGVVDAANAGLIDPTHLLTYSASLTPRSAIKLLTSDAKLVITDSNRKAARRWGAARENDGYTEMADEKPPAYDPTDNRLPIFPDETTDDQTVAIQEGGLRVRASDYGNQLTYTPGDRAVGAFDNDTNTAWKVGAFSDVRGQWIEASSTTGPITTDHIGLLQAQTFVNRFITRLDLSFDGGPAVAVSLDASSRTGAGQVINFPKRSFTTVRLTIRVTDPPDPQNVYRQISGVGFARIDLDQRVVTETVRPPIDLVKRLGTKTADHDLSYVFARRRSNPSEAVVRSDELQIVRRVDPQTARDFAVSGTARIDTAISDDRVDALLGTATNGATITTSGRLNGDLISRGSKAFDGNPDTWWQTPLSSGAGSWIQWASPTPTAMIIDGFDVVNDANHSIPRSFHLDVDGVAGPSIKLSGATTASGTRWKTAHLTAATPQQVTGTTIRVVIDSIDSRTQPDWLSKRPVVMPMGIAEIGTPPATPLVGADPTELDATCRTGLLTIGGVDVPVRLTGTTAAAEANDPIAMSGCSPVTMEGTDTDIVGTDGRSTGLDLDAITLESPAAASVTAAAAGAATPAASIRTTRTSRSSYEINASKLTKKTWLVLGQSLNDGWHLTVNGKDLGAPILVNGYANGWLLDPAIVGANPSLHLDWTPQDTVWIALGLSVIGFIICLALAFWPRRRRRATAASIARGLDPVAISFFDAYGAPVPWVTSAIVALASGLGTAALVTPMWWAIVVGAIALAATRTRRGWIALRFLAIAALGLTAAFVIAKQWRNGYPDDFDWPQKFSLVNPLAMVSEILLGVEITVEALRGGWRRAAGLNEGAWTPPPATPRSSRRSRR